MGNDLLNKFSLEGKTILVTGASSGIGRQIAIHTAALGGKVIAVGRNEERLNETLNLMHANEKNIFLTDITDEDAVKKLAQDIPKLDGIVHAAGIIYPYPVKFIGKNDIDNIFNVNYNGAVLLMTSIFKSKKINKNCSVIFLSSIAAQYPYPSGALYAGSKAALEAYSKCLVMENYRSGIRANCICPAMVKTPMYDKTFSFDTDNKNEEKMKKYEEYYLAGIAEAEDIADLSAFLLSDASRRITGQSITIDGGYILGLTSQVI